MTRLAALFLALAFAVTGCGYSTGGRATRIPAHVQTIAVPTFTNQTQTYRIEQTLTQAVARELLSRTKYRVVYEQGEDSDAVIRGTVVSTNLAPLTYDSQTGRASSALVTVNLKVQLVDRKGTVLFDNPNYVFREQYQVSREISSFFEEEGPAVERLARDLARTLVADLLEGF